MAIKNKFNTLTSDSKIAFKNRIIGGDFSINPWQRGTTFANAASGYFADRWQAGIALAGSAVTVAKVTDAPTFTQSGVLSESCMSWTVTTAQTSVTAGSYVCVLQQIEDYNVHDFGLGQAGTRFATVSFWVKSNKTGIYSGSLRNGNSTMSYVFEYTINTSATWEKKSITIPIATAGTWSYNAGASGLQLILSIAGGTTYATSAGSWQASNFLSSPNQVNLYSNVNNYWRIALVQIEYGSLATSFEQRSIQQELMLCQRYYEASDTSSFYGQMLGNADNYRSWSIPFKVKKRVVPVMTTAGGNANFTPTATTNEFYGTSNAGNATGNLYFTNWTANAEM